ncbi:hypothetical protein FA95DRAFT_1557485 [Auriscalpium vulgare]|uniref:Uncharacterized protein n=1 Tax=Auriscalpium vulgare TaxID=40419 RepID=A0ACB8RYJ9_9AGAM|nr:hypothetical protein FA95DRAFT_1557485 [Auriscalpium vulgare]
MADKTYEIVNWPASEAFLADHSIIGPVYDALTDRAGTNEIYTGVQVEAQNVFCVVSWDKLKDHLDYINDAENYKQLIADLNKTRADVNVIDLVHAQFLSDPRSTFTAPVTEFAYLTPKEGVAKEVVQEIILKIVDHSNDPKSTPRSAAYGSLLEKPETFLLVLGWTSAQEHADAIKGGDLGELVADLRSNVDGRIVHAKLTHGNVVR